MNRPIEQMSRRDIVNGIEKIMAWLKETYRYNPLKSCRKENRLEWMYAGKREICYLVSCMMYNEFGVWCVISNDSDAVKGENPERLLSRKEVSELLGVVPATVTLYERRGLLEGVRNGPEGERVSGYTKGSVMKVIGMRDAGE